MYFFKPVGDVDDADTVLSQPVDRLEKFLNLVTTQRRRRFIHHQNLAIKCEGASNLHHLLIRDT